VVSGVDASGASLAGLSGADSATAGVLLAGTRATTGAALTGTSTTAAAAALSTATVAARELDRDVAALATLCALRVALTFGAELTTTLHALEARIGEARGDQLDRTDGIVVRGDDEVDLVGIAVGVGDGDDRDVEFAALTDRDVLVVRVDDEDRRGHAVHGLDAAQELLELLALTVEHEGFLLGEAFHRAVFDHALERAQTLDAGLDGAEVGQRAAEPAVVDEELACTSGLFLNDVLSLTLGADEQHVAATTHRLDDEVVGALEERRRLVEIDDVDAVARAVDERAHLRVPALGLVAEVAAGLDEVLHADGQVAQCYVAAQGLSGLTHGCSPLVWTPIPVAWPPW